MTSTSDRSQCFRTLTAPMLLAIGMVAAVPAVADPLDINANRTESTSTNYQGGHGPVDC